MRPRFLFQFPVSVVIPIHRGKESAGCVLNAVLDQRVQPVEIIVVNSFPEESEEESWQAVTRKSEEAGSVLRVINHRGVLLPGAARNLGITEATQPWLAFLDCETIPCEDWLKRQVESIQTSNSLGSFGSTSYAANSVKQKLVRDAIYGRSPLQTLPGSVLRKDLFNLVGQFIPSVRAAEDTEWMIRAKVMGAEIEDSPNQTLVYYQGLTKLGFKGLIRKWRRNYLSSRQLQHLKVQTMIIWMSAYVMVSFIAFNWNAIAAGWKVDSPFYIDHVTKIASLTPVGLYIFFRGFYLPFRRGVPFSDIFPFRFLLLAAVGALLDSVKVTTIFFPRAS
jgi:glycosyltransferase involved in cell wall biosynthesis